MNSIAHYAQKACLHIPEESEIVLSAEVFTPTKKLLTYRVPLLSEDGSCSIDDSLQKEPYDLREILGIKDEVQETNVVEQLAKFHGLLNAVQQKLKADWIGIYQAITNAPMDPVLVKLAYIGSPSRAEFPLTEDFAKGSNNSTVGLSGRAIVIDRVSSYQGAYYKCDAKVQSEACLPIFDKEFSKVIGIVDAESFTEDHFGPQKLETFGTTLPTIKCAYAAREIKGGIQSSRSDFVVETGIPGLIARDG